MPPERTAKKRRAPEDGGAKKKRKKPVREDEEDLDVEAGLNRSFERMDSQLVADHIAQKTSRFGTDLSSVELSDLYISGKRTPRWCSPGGQANVTDWGQANDIKDTTSWEKPRTLDNLPDFLEAFAEDVKKLGEAPKAKGAPHTLIVAPAGLRAADLVRQVYRVGGFFLLRHD